ncbi:MAG: hypothetical protein Q8P80_04515 [Candidatus Levybacteria bacterium]|nr:hypothetical protein [Candidatus Levybacteria bacterium]
MINQPIESYQNQTITDQPSVQPPPPSQKSNKRTIKITIIFIAISTLAAFLIGGFVLGSKNKNNPPAGGPKACTQEAKLCPDGSYVSRTGPNCEFSTCPKSSTIDENQTTETPNWKRYQQPNGLYSIKYPLNFYYEENINNHGNCKKQLTIMDDKKRDIIKYPFGDENEIIGNIVIDVCSIPEKEISYVKSLYLEGPSPSPSKLDGYEGLEARGLTDFSGIGYNLGYGVYVDRKVLFKDNLTYFIDFRYKLPSSGGLPKDYKEKLDIFNQILQTFHFIK